MNEEVAKAPSAKAKSLSARLLAVQALFQMKQRDQAVKDIYDEYVEHRIDQEIEGQKLVEPDAGLFKKILFGVYERFAELEAVIQANLKRDDNDRMLDPIMFSILMCGAYELLAHEDIDAPIIINDYMNVGHSFFENNEVALINGVLDSVCKIFR